MWFIRWFDKCVKPARLVLAFVMVIVLGTFIFNGAYGHYNSLITPIIFINSAIVILLTIYDWQRIREMNKKRKANGDK